jgi:hypothetical protein
MLFSGSASRAFLQCPARFGPALLRMLPGGLRLGPGL